ncbi:bacteriochlorophyll 4-vinyl reductase [Paracoccaceae bacterium Fryx2]|nr:bacteriochlorophyll 4-vinyl reductase [Paracoccaceae bacterium Fryx2]
MIAMARPSGHDNVQGHRIGPNAVLQLHDVLEREEGAQIRRALFACADLIPPPPDAGMLPEDEVARLHHALRLYLPHKAPHLSRLAGLAVGDYILANRIPKLAQRLIKALPAPLGARLLAIAITKHAWTFAGSGAFRVVNHRPLTFEIANNPLVASDTAATPQCHWHAAVFERLFSQLVWPDVTVEETTCCACGDPACVFVLHPNGKH